MVSKFDTLFRLLVINQLHVVGQNYHFVKLRAFREYYFITSIIFTTHGSCLFILNHNLSMHVLNVVYHRIADCIHP